MLKGRKTWKSQFRKRVSLRWFHLFVPPRALYKLDDRHQHWGSCIFTQLNWVKCSSFPGIPFTDIPRTDILPAIWVSFNPFKLTHKINCRCLWPKRSYIIWLQLYLCHYLVYLSTLPSLGFSYSGLMFPWICQVHYLF